MWDCFMFEIEMRLFGNAADGLCGFKVTCISVLAGSKRLKDDSQLNHLSLPSFLSSSWSTPPAPSRDSLNTHSRCQETTTLLPSLAVSLLNDAKRFRPAANHNKKKLPFVFFSLPSSSTINHHPSSTSITFDPTHLLHPLPVTH